MKTFLIRICCILVLLLAADRIVGYLLQRGYQSTTWGAIGRKNTIINKVNSDVLILGSSRALHHYVPSIISDSLHMSCFNCGQGGQGIIYHYTLLRAITQRYMPKMIIYEMTYDYDVAPSDNARFLGEVRTIGEHGCRDSVLRAVGHYEAIKMLSSIYPYNSLLLHILGDNMQRKNLLAYNGMIPMKGELAADDNYVPAYKNTTLTDSVKIGFLEKMLREYSKLTRLVVVVSPVYGANRPAKYQQVQRLCQRYGVAYINNSGDIRFTHSPALWSDHAHLNSSGAALYTQTVCSKLRLLMLRAQ